MTHRAAIVGSGPNGLAAAITLARAGLRVDVYEAAPHPGGALRSAPLTLPGFTHDVGSAIHPLALASPFFRTLPLERYGLQWVHPDHPVAHPLDDDAVILHRSVDATADELGPDGPAYRRLLQPLVDHADALFDATLHPLLRLPPHPFALARFGLLGLPPAELLARAAFRTPRARALFAGLSAHANLPLSTPGSSAYGLMLALTAHAVGWPFPRGGAGTLTDVLIAYLQHLGGRIHLSTPINHLRELDADLKLLNVTPPELLRLAGDTLPAPYAVRLRRYRFGPGIYKVDYALSEPIPWRDPRARRAGTVHVAGPLADVVTSEAAAPHHAPHRPYLLLAQHTPFDPTRAPHGQHTAWVYGHVPNGSDPHLLPNLEAQIERFAPGFRDVILARTVTTPTQAQADNRNLLGGDVAGGLNTLWQTLARPVFSPTPYRTPLPGVYLCSASTPPAAASTAWAATSPPSPPSPTPTATEATRSCAGRGAARAGRGAAPLPAQRGLTPPLLHRRQQPQLRPQRRRIHPVRRHLHEHQIEPLRAQPHRPRTPAKRPESHLLVTANRARIERIHPQHHVLQPQVKHPVLHHQPRRLRPEPRPPIRRIEHAHPQLRRALPVIHVPQIHDTHHAPRPALIHPQRHRALLHAAHTLEPRQFILQAERHPRAPQVRRQLQILEMRREHRHVLPPQLRQHHPITTQHRRNRHASG
ncbi:amine oxidase [Deinococcus maricopensis DSM 21211]|uniref:Amine oxidase n=1 Tax=Deinococcus maricopensis (strain DSM 21211 / LMG 22137 / NRRL B-23946 / LB-34) TaxID=709986 RepID=E8UAJ5_DEIML|nr:amine oxidase [Deinococcus maricopensis DSM 21211]